MEKRWMTFRCMLSIVRKMPLIRWPHDCRRHSGGTLLLRDRFPLLCPSKIIALKWIDGFVRWYTRASSIHKVTILNMIYVLYNCKQWASIIFNGIDILWTRWYNFAMHRYSQHDIWMNSHCIETIELLGSNRNDMWMKWNSLFLFRLRRE